jgi:hypothetical protein
MKRHPFLGGQEDDLTAFTFLLASRILAWVPAGFAFPSSLRWQILPGIMSRRIRPMNEIPSTAELEASIKHFFH